MSSSETRPLNTNSLWWHPKKRKDRQTVHKKKKRKKKKLQDGRGGVQKGTKGNGGWTDLGREKNEIKLDQIVFK